MGGSATNARHRVLHYALSLAHCTDDTNQRQRFVRTPPQKNIAEVRRLGLWSVTFLNLDKGVFSLSLAFMNHLRVFYYKIF